MTTLKPQLYWPAAALLGLVSFGVYLATLSPTIGVDDTGEMAAAICTMGIPHPPGYPLFMLVGKLFTWIPLGSPAMRINLSAAVFAVLTVALLTYAVARAARSNWAGILAGGGAAFSPLLWRWAVIGEKFALGNFFVALLFLLVILYCETRRPSFALGFAFAFGLGLCNHHTLVWWGLPCFLAIVFVGRGEIWAPKRLAQMGALGALGLLPYLYLPLVARTAPLYAWSDLTSWSAVLDHLLRREFGPLQLANKNPADQATFLAGLMAYVRQIPREAFYVGPLLAVVGVGGLFVNRAQRVIAVLLSGAFVFYVISFHALANLPLGNPLYLRMLSRFWQLPQLLLFAAMGFAVPVLVRLLGRWAAGMLVVAIVLAQLAVNYRHEDQSRAWVFHDAVSRTLEGMPRNSIFLASGDFYHNVAAYLRFCEKQREDVAVVWVDVLKARWMKAYLGRVYPSLRLPGDVHLLDVYRANGDRSSTLAVYDTESLLAANVAGHAVFTSGDIEGLSPTSSFEFWPMGMVDLVRDKRQAFDLAQYIDASSALFTSLRAVMEQASLDQPWQAALVEEYRLKRHERARLLLETARGSSDERLLDFAGQELMTLEAEWKVPPRGFYKNLGVYYYLCVGRRPESRAGAIAAWSKFVKLSPAGDPEAARIATVLESLR